MDTNSLESEMLEWNSALKDCNADLEVCGTSVGSGRLKLFSLCRFGNRRYSRLGNLRYGLAAALVGALLLTSCATKSERVTTADVPSAVESANVLKIMERVADWQIAHPAKYRTTDWTQGALYAGIMALDEVSPSSRFREEMRRVGEGNDWKLGPSRYNADDQCVGQMYAELCMRTGDTNMIAPMRAQLDSIIEKPSPVTSLDFTRRGAGDRWSWCDSLFMAPPVWTRLWKATGDRRYLDYAVTNWWITSEYLYDTHEHLFYRDSTYFERLESNGKRVFWGRGNGWVLAGLARVIQDLPQDHPSRGKFVQQFREMSEKILECQQPDGLWRSSLLDPDSYPLKETSGSGFYAYGLAWGVNNGLLDRKRFAPAVNQAWVALVDCVTPEGKLTHVQPIGADPKKFDLNHTDAYGVGAFLLAGSEIYRMNGGKLPPPKTVKPSKSRPATAQDFQKVVERYRDVALRGDPDWSSEKSATTSSAKLREWMTSLSAEGSWADVDYQDQDRAFWKCVVHLDRTRLLAKAWTDPNSSLHHNADLESATLRALDFWLAKRFQNPNWWWNQIGVPGYMADILALLNEKLTGERRTAALEILAQSGNPRSGSGANTIWIADLALQRGALMSDAKLIAECSRILAGEIKITTEDGIQPDYSFHQHYARLQQFSYGRPYLSTAARIAWQLQGTWSVPDDKVEILADLALRGDQWMCRGIYTVPSTIDRSVSRPGTLAWSDIRTTLKQLVELLPARANELKQFIARQNGNGEPLTGARNFPRSDFATFHRPAFSFFLKTVSDRTLLSEVGLNDENLKGALQNCGDHYLLRDGREYLDLAPVWDWKLLPGVTFGEGAGELQRQAFVGSVTDGRDIASAMDYRFGTKNETRLGAKKFWAAHGDVVICLIADLNAPELQQPLRTALDQCRWRGAVTICDETGNQFSFSGGETNVNARWVHHAGFGYAPLGGLSINVRAESSSGSWQAINRALSSETVTAPVFLPVLEHGIAPVHQNSGFVIAAGNVSNMATVFKKPSWRVLRNDSDVQAVKFEDGTTLAAFYGAGESVGQGRFELTADQPCIVLARKKRIWACDPTQHGRRVTIRWNGKSQVADLPANGMTIELR